MECELCKIKHDGKYGSGRFCSQKCVRSFATKMKRKEINEKVSKTLTERGIELRKNRSNICKNCGKIFISKNKKKKYCNLECGNAFRRGNYDKWKAYGIDCRFKFNVYNLPDKFDLKLIDDYGWYKAKNRGDNPYGINRDHVISVKYGFINNLDSKIISHPANCQLILHSENVSKKSKCGMTLEELIRKIAYWNSI